MKMYATPTCGDLRELHAHGDRLAVCLLGHLVDELPKSSHESLVQGTLRVTLLQLFIVGALLQKI
jgi:hypothetical protein